LPRIDSPFPNKPISWPQIYIGVGLTTLASLMLELTLTRMFSVVFHYHFAFLAISIALFGLGAGGVMSYLLSARPGKVFGKMGILSTLNAVVVPLSLMFLLTQSKELDNWTLAAVYFMAALPFLLAGAVVALVIAETIERVDRVYFFDLMGAALGCILVVVFLDILGGPNTILATAVLFAAAGAIWFHVEGRIQGRAAAVLIGVALTSLVILNFKKPVVEVKWAKGQQMPEERFTKWNAFSRIGLLAKEPIIVIDADANTYIATTDLNKVTREDEFNLLSSGPALPHRLARGAKTLIIGAGGGLDVLRALLTGSRDVTAVEINPIIANTIMREKFPELSHNLYSRPEVRVVVEDGRSFVRRSNEKYDVIQATLVDTWASTAAGAFALTENNLYTTEAFVDYLSHLTDNGMLAFTRWGFEPPRESLRLLSLAREALLRMGEKEPWRHVLVGRQNKELAKAWGAVDTVIITRKPMALDRMPGITSQISAAGMTTIYYPGYPFPNAFSTFMNSPDPAQYYRDYPYDITPVSDNRPFFFFTVQPRDILDFMKNAIRASADYKINRAVPVLFGLVGISLLATLVTLALPPLLLGARLPSERGVRRFLLYFASIGVGYILIQVALIQKFVLFLGQPTYSLTVIIFSMLVSSGLGSYYSKKLRISEPKRWRKTLVIVAVMVLLLAMVVGPITSFGVGWPLGIKIPLAVLLIAPVGFVMGMPFPTGLSYLEKKHSASVRWAWSLNAASSVMGSACAMFFGLYLGLQMTLVLGGVLYLAAMTVVHFEHSGDRPAVA
jgi:MFS family permease